MSGPDPAVAAVRRAVRDACSDLPAGALVLVACSGGPDSLALAAAAAWLTGPSRGPRALPWRAGAVVVDHGLQDGSPQVARRAAAQCAELGLAPVEVVAADVPRRGPGWGGPEAAARTARHAALRAVAARSGAAAVLLGHTRDDQAEQVLLGLARGSGARSLAGMAARRELLRRPLLDLPRSVTLAACAAEDLQPWHDPTNTLTGPGAPLRSRVRGVVLPALEAELGPGVAAALARTAALLRRDADALDALARELVVAAGAPGGDGPAATGTPDAAPVLDLDVAVLAAAAPAVRHRALRAVALAAGSPASDLAHEHVEALDSLVVAWRGQGPLHLPGPVEAVRACGRLALARPAAPGEPSRT